MNGVYTILLLLLSNIFMTLAWYGHLRLQQSLSCAVKGYTGVRVIDCLCHHC